MSIKKPFVLRYQSSGPLTFYLQSFKYDNNGFSFDLCLDAIKAMIFDDHMFSCFRSFFAACSDEPFPFSSIFPDCVHNKNLNI